MEYMRWMVLMHTLRMRVDRGRVQALDVVQLGKFAAIVRRRVAMNS